MKTVSHLILLLLFSLSACTNITQGTKGLNTNVNPSVLLTSFSAASYTHVLTNVNVKSLDNNGGTTTPPLQMTLTANTGQPNYQSLIGFCASGTNTCSCELKWNVAPTFIGGSSYARSRKVPIVISDVESGRVKCNFSNDFWNEISNGTVIQLNIVPSNQNGAGLNCKYISYKKGSNIAANGDFLDDTLTPFRNIHRYSCFTKRQASFQILNAYAVVQPSATPSGGGTAPQSDIELASKFCTGAAATPGTNCSNPRNGWSAQSYYRNFYIRSDQLGQINSTNNTYDCPKVAESLSYSAGQSIPASDQGKYWPLDTTFALATTFSSDWNVGVRAASLLSKSGDPTSNPSSAPDACTNEDTSKRIKEGGTITKCLGYAKKPNSDGTCSSIKDSNGHVRPMVRLRRYRVIYPPVFQANGASVPGNSNADEVYVADRLVMNSSGVPTGNMIYGPKPCNYAWFDHEGVTKRNAAIPAPGFMSDLASDGPGVYPIPGYVATSNYQYSGISSSYSVNPDGLVFPNRDISGVVSNGATYPSCSASLPVVMKQLNAPDALRIVTTQEGRLDSITLGSRNFFLKEVHIQPIDPWTPNYLEDTSFNACAPMSDPYLEPPLHFYKSATSLGWCSEVYPTQNPYWVELNAVKKPTGTAINSSNYPNFGIGAAYVSNYTSHRNLNSGGPSEYLDSKNACTGTNEGAVCGMTLPGAACMTYLAKSVNKTCDRTVLFDSNQQYRGFPLLASDVDINAMLANDLSNTKSFSCQYSVSSDPTKVNAKIPSSGCCGVVTGVPLLQNLILGGAGSGGHLEPYKDPSAPTIRFCGSPIE